MKRTFFLTCLFLMACLGMQAQNLQVSGTVISKSDDLPVIGATVLEKGTTNGTITDFDGKFSLTVKQGAEIVVSYVGFKSQTLKANSVLNRRSLKVPWNNPILAKDSTYPIQEEWNISNAM